MTVIRQNGEQVLLPRTGPDDFWQDVETHYAGAHQNRWKALAILALRENAGWRLEMIAAAFGHHKGHISRTLAQIKSELRDSLHQSPEWLGRGNRETPPPDKGFSNPNP